MKMKDIQERVALRFNTTVDHIVGRRRDRSIVYARHVAINLCLEFCPRHSTLTIGRAFGRDHTTILHARNEFRAKVERDGDLLMAYAKLRAELAAEHEAEKVQARRVLESLEVRA